MSAAERLVVERGDMGFSDSTVGVVPSDKNNVVTSRDLILQELGSDWQVACFDVVGSTMDAARELTGSPALILANQMTAGRGRQGRVWNAAAGALLMTLRFETKQPIAQLAGLSLMVAVITREFLTAQGVPVQVKWPNDLIVEGGRKIGGILIEVSALGGLSCALIGVGINLVGVPENVLKGAALSEFTSAVRPVSQVAVELAERLYAGFIEFERAGFAPFRESWLAGALGLGVEWQVAEGESVVCGKMVGVDSIGRLLLQTPDELIKIAGGHVVKIEGMT